MPCPPSFEETELARLQQRDHELRAVVDVAWSLLAPSAELARALLALRPERADAVREFARALDEATALGALPRAQVRWVEPPAVEDAPAHCVGWDELYEDLRRRKFQVERLAPLVVRAELALCILGTFVACWRRDVGAFSPDDSLAESAHALLAYHAAHRRHERDEAIAAAATDAPEQARLAALDATRLECDRDCLRR